MKRRHAKNTAALLPNDILAEIMLQCIVFRGPNNAINELMTLTGLRMSRTNKYLRAYYLAHESGILGRVGGLYFPCGAAHGLEQISRRAYVKHNHGKYMWHYEARPTYARVSDENEKIILRFTVAPCAWSYTMGDMVRNWALINYSYKPRGRTMVRMSRADSSTPLGRSILELILRDLGQW